MYNMPNIIHFTELQRLVTNRNFSSVVKKNINYTNYLLENFNIINLNEAIFLFKNNLDKTPICELEGCTNFKAFYDKGTPHKYLLGCCKEHTLKISMIEKYGVDNISKLSEYREKAKSTMIEKYGVDNISKLSEYREKAKSTMLEKYGVDHPLKSEEIKDKIKKTNLEKYGCEWSLANNEIKTKSRITFNEKYGVNHNSQIIDIKIKKQNKSLEKYGTPSPLASKEIQDKSKITLGKIYGVNHNSQIEDVKIKKKKTVLEKYGVENVFAATEIQEKAKKSMFKKYGVEHISQSKLLMTEKKLNFIHSKLNFLKDTVKPDFDVDAYVVVETVLKWICTQCNTKFTDHLDNGHIPRCKKCYPNKNNSGVSFLEEQLFDSILANNKIKSDRTILNGKELDIYIPEHNLAIEFNGIYWHSELNGKDKNYHLNKTMQCEEKGIQLIHVFENEWLTKKDIVLSIIHSKMNIFSKRLYARQCTVKEISKAEKIHFLEENHLQGDDKSSIKIGLFYNSELVGVMTFDISQQNINNQYVMHRFCSKLNYQIIGGASKLLNYFVKNHNPDSIITYADRRYSNNGFYETIGFDKGECTLASEWYFGKDIIGIDDKLNWQKDNLVSKLDKFDNNLTVWENMMINGYDRIWDCGNYEFIWFKK